MQFLHYHPMHYLLLLGEKKEEVGREQKNYNKTGDKGKEKTMRSEFVLIKGF